MIDLIKKAMYTGIGFAALTREKVEEVARDFVEQGKMSEQEGRKMVDELMAKSKESKEELARHVEVLVQHQLEKLDMARKSEMEELRAELSGLRERLQALEQK